MYTKTDFKFIGKIESQTNDWRKKFSPCSFYMIFFQKPIGLLIDMPNYSGNKNLKPNSWFNFFLWSLQNRAFSPTLGKTLKRCNLKMCIFLWKNLELVLNAFLWMLNKFKKKTFSGKKSHCVFKGRKGGPFESTKTFFSAKCFFSFNIHKKCISYQFKTFFTKICR